MYNFLLSSLFYTIIIIIHMSLFASIDVGSNTIRLLIGTIEDNRILDVFTSRKITRLASGISGKHGIRKLPFKKSVEVLRDFSAIISQHKIHFIKAVGTSALREASNADAFIDKVFSETGISIEVISGEQEAELTMKGISFSLINSRFESRPLFVMDIGGGSTEWVFSQENGLFITGSIPVGVIKLAGEYNMSDPPSKSQAKRMQNLFMGFLRDIQKTTGYFQGRAHFIGTAGTFTTLASIDLSLEKYSREKIHLHTIPNRRLKKMYTELSSISLRERKHVRGLEPERADLIIPGLHFTINAMDFFHFKELTVSDYGLLEGVLIELRDSVEKNISAAKKP